MFSSILHCTNTDMFSEQDSDIGCEVLVLVDIKNAVIWHMANRHQYFGRTCCLYWALPHTQSQSFLFLPFIIYQFSHISSFTTTVMGPPFSSLCNVVPVFSLVSVLFWRWWQQVLAKCWKYAVSHARSLILRAVMEKCLKKI